MNREKNFPKEVLVRDRAGPLRQYGYPAAAILAIVLAWQLFVVLFHVPTFVLPAPTMILVRVVQESDLLFSHALVTAVEVLLGFALSVVVSIPLAVVIVYSRFLERTLYPLMVISQTVPKIAVAPLFVIWFGFGSLPKILIAFLIAFFPIVIDTVVGLRSLETEMIHLARSMGARAVTTFWKFRFPNALPNVFGGLKVAITFAVVGAVVGEFVGANRGLGYLLLVANGNIDTVLLFAGIFVLTLMGIAAFMMVDMVERVLLRWHVSQRQIETHAATF